MASFPWLTNFCPIPGHMTMLFWEFDGEPRISKRHVDAVRAIVKTFDRPYRRTEVPKPGQSFLFSEQGDPAVDPGGPVGEMIAAFCAIDPEHMPHNNSCGQGPGLDGLHVTAGMATPPRRFKDDPALLARHSYSTWATDGARAGWELP